MIPRQLTRERIMSQRRAQLFSSTSSEKIEHLALCSANFEAVKQLEVRNLCQTDDSKMCNLSFV